MLHTSDVHLGAYTSQPYREEADGSESLEPALNAFKHVLELGIEADVDVVAIAGDFFDHVRVKRPYVEVTGELMEAVGRPVVVLPGNHDPHMPEGIYQKFADAFPSNVHIIASAEGELVLLEEHGVQFWGQAHESYNDFSPASARPAWANDPERYIWRVAMAHGYYVGTGESRYSYQIHASEVQSLGADYVALGHIDVHEGVRATGRSRLTTRARRATPAARRLWTSAPRASSSGMNCTTARSPIRRRPIPCWLRGCTS